MSSTPTAILGRLREVQKLLDGIANDVAELAEQPVAVPIVHVPPGVPPEIYAIQEKVAAAYNLPVAVMREQRRGNERHCRARNVAMCLAYDLRTPEGARMYSGAEVAEAFNRTAPSGICKAHARILLAVGYDSRGDRGKVEALRKELGITNGATKA